ncbi:hypothetical protein [Sphingobacterium sp. 1.A.5]|uniref:hypothetical protein n=1 Tax=Sphingobacterium sp. 1.A.5 TaxID=2044604 RepID=UPI000C0BD8DB|nr:hypothetical protein [Sphingobacterium sp. 1.A.5]
MRIFIMVMVCALLTGCGLFKKSKKIDKTLSSIEVSKDVKVSTDTKKEQVDRSKTDVKSNVQSDESTKVYPTKGTEVKINPDGSMTFHADSIIQKARRNSNEAKNIANDIKNTLDQKADSASNENGKLEQKQSSFVKNSEPDKWGIFVSKIGWAIAFLVILIGVCWWFFGMKKK